MPSRVVRGGPAALRLRPPPFKRFSVIVVVIDSMSKYSASRFLPDTMRQMFHPAAGGGAAFVELERHTVRLHETGRQFINR